MTFANALRNKANETRTEKGGKTFVSSNSAVLDLFGNGGALRARSAEEVLNLVNLAAKEDLELTLRCLFYLRDVRGGQGERRTFRLAIEDLAKAYPDAIKNNLQHVATFGRFDDLFGVLDTGLAEDVMVILRGQLEKDRTSLNPSLLGKWMPSENTSSKATRRRARKIRGSLRMSPKTYRKMLSDLRTKINIVEKLMCNKQFDKIDYSKVSSRAAMIYRKAFLKRDEGRYNKFLELVKQGKATIKATTLYPYDLMHNAYDFASDRPKHDATIDALWNALPNYIETGKNALVVCDTSGSMTCGVCGKTSVTPLEVASSLAIYIAERNHGAFHNLFMTFNDNSHVVQVRGNTLADKAANLYQTPWGGTTNLQAAFDSILETAIKNNCPQEDMPVSLIIISDMQFDPSRGCVRGAEATAFELARAKFAAQGYALPDVIFWQVASRSDQVPVTKDTRGAFLVSGCSPAVLKFIFNKVSMTPYELMLETLNSPKYQVINV